MANELNLFLKEPTPVGDGCGTRPKIHRPQGWVPTESYRFKRHHANTTWLAQAVAAQNKAVQAVWLG